MKDLKKRKFFYCGLNIEYENMEKENNHMIDWMFTDIIQMLMYLTKDGIGRQILLEGSTKTCF